LNKIILGTFLLATSLTAIEPSPQNAAINPSIDSTIQSQEVFDAIIFELWIEKMSKLNIEELDTLKTGFDDLKKGFSINEPSQRAKGQQAIYNAIIGSLQEAIKVKSSLEAKDLQYKLSLLNFGQSLLEKKWHNLDKISLTKEQKASLNLLNTYPLSEKLASGVPFLLSSSYEDKANLYIQSNQNPKVLEEIRSGYVSK
jgi:hypothetical protein